MARDPSHLHNRRKDGRHDSAPGEPAERHYHTFDFSVEVRIIESLRAPQLRTYYKLIQPLVEQRQSISPPADGTADEYYCRWYKITDTVNYLSLKLYSGRVKYNACFHNLKEGLQTNVYAPFGLSINRRWIVNRSLLEEPRQAVEVVYPQVAFN